MSRYTCWSFLGTDDLKSFCLLGPSDEIEVFLKTYFGLRSLRVVCLEDLSQVHQKSFFDGDDETGSVFLYRIHPKIQKDLRSLDLSAPAFETKKIVFFAEKTFLKDKKLLASLPCFEWALPTLQEWNQVVFRSSPHHAGVSRVPEYLYELSEALRGYHYDLDLQSSADLTMIDGNSWEKMSFLIKNPHLISTLSLQEMQHLSYALDHVETVIAFGARSPKPLPKYLAQDLVLKKDHSTAAVLEIYQTYLLALSQGQVLHAQQALRLWMDHRSLPRSG